MLALNLPDNWAIWPTAVVQVMADPALERPGALAEIMDRTAKVRSAEHLADTPIGLAFYQAHRAEILSAASGERPMDYLNSIRRDLKSGEIFRPSMAGLILLVALDWDARGSCPVSLEKIYGKISKVCQNRLRGAQRRELARTWTYYRRVSHLSATWLLFQSEWPAICRSRKRLLAWLAHAERLRCLGASCQTWRSPKQPQLLDLDNTWSLMPSDPLPEINVRIPSSDAILKSLVRAS